MADVFHGSEEYDQMLVLRGMKHNLNAYASNSRFYLLKKSADVSFFGAPGKKERPLLLSAKLFLVRTMSAAKTMAIQGRSYHGLFQFSKQHRVFRMFHQKFVFTLFPSPSQFPIWHLRLSRGRNALPGFIRPCEQFPCF